MDQEQESLQQMSFWDHIDALRAVLVRIIVVLVVVAIGLFAAMPMIFDNVILAPCHGDFVLYRLFERMTAQVPWLPQFTTGGFEVQLINIKLASQFFIHMSTSFWLALVLTFPVVLYLLWTFVAPALYPSEKRGVKTAFLIGCLMFFLGVAVGYFIVFPVTLRFLADYLNGDTYFKVNYPGHNLVRTRCQLALAKDILRKKEELKWIVEETLDNA